MALPWESEPGCLRIKAPATVDGALVVHGQCEPSFGGSRTVRLANSPTSRKNGIYAWRTGDGRDWTRRPVTPGLQDLDCIAEDPARLVALDYGTPLVASDDGIDWVPVGDVPIDRGPPDSACVYPTASGYLQVGGIDGGSATSVSLDGRTRTPTQALTGFELELDGVAVLGDTVVLDGFQSDPDSGGSPVPAQLISTDAGATWAPTSGWPSTTMAADGEVFVAVGDGAWATAASSIPVS